MHSIVNLLLTVPQYCSSCSIQQANIYIILTVSGYCISELTSCYLHVVWSHVHFFMSTRRITHWLTGSQLSNNGRELTCIPFAPALQCQNQLVYHCAAGQQFYVSLKWHLFYILNIEDSYAIPHVLFSTQEIVFSSCNTH